MASATLAASLSNVKTGTGTTVDFLTAKNRVTAVFSVRNSITGGVVLIEASHDGTVWVTKHGFGALQGQNMAFDNSLGAYRFWRARVVDDIRGGGDASVTFMEAD